MWRLIAVSPKDTMSFVMCSSKSGQRSQYGKHSIMPQILNGFLEAIISLVLAEFSFNIIKSDKR